MAAKILKNISEIDIRCMFESATFDLYRGSGFCRKLLKTDFSANAELCRIRSTITLSVRCKAEMSASYRAFASNLEIGGEKNSGSVFAKFFPIFC